LPLFRWLIKLNLALSKLGLKTGDMSLNEALAYCEAIKEDDCSEEIEE